MTTDQLYDYLNRLETELRDLKDDQTILQTECNGVKNELVQIKRAIHTLECLSLPEADCS